MVLSNDIAAHQDFIIQEGADNEYYLIFNDADDLPIDLTTLQAAKLEVRDYCDRVKDTYSLGNGITVDPTDSTRLLWRKEPAAHNIPPDQYEYDLRIQFSAETVRYVMRGTYTVINDITES